MTQRPPQVKQQGEIGGERMRVGGGKIKTVSLSDMWSGKEGFVGPKEKISFVTAQSGHPGGGGKRSGEDLVRP